MSIHNHSEMEKPTLSMYMLLVETEKETDLHKLYETIKKYQINKKFKIKQMEIEFTPQNCKHPSGKLHEMINETDNITTIGSVDMKIKIDNKLVSILFFKSKIKISGGLPDHLKCILDDMIIDSYFQCIADVISILYIESKNVKNIKKCLINGNMKLPMKIIDYMKLCERIKNDKKYERIVMPFTNQRGRICAIKIYPFAKSKSSVHFDHKGKLQFFGFTEVEMIHFMSEEIQKDIYRLA